MKLFAKKSLGQHFLNSKHVLDQIIGAAAMQKGEKVLEIGPGTGVLTRELLNAGAEVIAVEKDVRAIEMLKITFEKEIRNCQLTLIAGDILEDSVSYLTPLSSYSLIANIPYYITGAILEKFLEHGPRPNRMVLLVQKEVAERIVARDGKKSILSVSVKAFGTPKIIAKVPPGAFTPPPTVDSAILSISSISDDLFSKNNADISHFFKVVKAAFAHKRKFATRNLEDVMKKEEIEAIWQKYGLDPKVRAEDMTLEQWVCIAGRQ